MHAFAWKENMFLQKWLGSLFGAVCGCKVTWESSCSSCIWKKWLWPMYKGRYIDLGHITEMNTFITCGSEIVIGRARRRCIEKIFHLHSQWICLTLTKCRDHVIGLLLISDLYLPADQIFAICLNRFGNGNSSFLSPYQKGSNADLWTQVKIDCRCVHAW